MLAQELALLQRAQRRDVAAFEELLRPYQAQLFRLVLAIAGNREDAEDSLQESLVRAYKALPGFRGDAAVATWLTRIALNTTRNWLRSQARASSERIAQHVSPCGANLAPDPSHDFLQQERRQLVRNALLALPECYRNPLLMRHYQEMSYSQIADVLQIPIGTVRSRLAQGRALLLRKLKATGYPMDGEET